MRDEESGRPAAGERQAATVHRRRFLTGVGMAGAAAAAPTALWPARASAKAPSSPTKGDIAILRFLAAAELLETDLWQQYNELGGEDGGNKAYRRALANVDDDIPDYIDQNTDDEESHAEFLNAYLVSHGADPVDLDAFRTLPPSQATGARQVPRLTNLMALNVDTSFYTRYRSPQNPDFGASFPQAVDIQGQPAIPLNDHDTPPDMNQPVPPSTRQQRRMQAIANTAAWHFAMIEQGGTSLYAALAQKASNAEVLEIVVSIGGAEVVHFSIWHDALGGSVSGPLAGVTDPETGVHFPNLNAPPFGGDLFSTEQVMPEPCEFISPSLPLCSVIRPVTDRFAGAVAAANALTADGLFNGQSPAFFNALTALAQAADGARRR